MSVDFGRYLFEVHPRIEDLADKYQAYARQDSTPIYSLLGFALQQDAPSATRSAASPAGYTGRGHSPLGPGSQDADPTTDPDRPGSAGGDERERKDPGEPSTGSGRKTPPAPPPPTAAPDCADPLSTRAQVNQPAPGTYTGSGSLTGKTDVGNSGSCGADEGYESVNGCRRTTVVGKGLAEISEGLTPGLITGLNAGLTTESTTGFTIGFTTDLTTGLTPGLTQGLTTGLTTGLTQGLTSGLPAAECKMNNESVSVTMGGVRSDICCSESRTWGRAIIEGELQCNGRRGVERLRPDVSPPLPRLGHNKLQMAGNHNHVSPTGNPNHVTATGNPNHVSVTGRSSSLPVGGTYMMRSGHCSPSMENPQKRTYLKTPNGAAMPKGGREVLPSIFHPRPPSPPTESCRNHRNSSSPSLSSLVGNRKVSFADEKGLTLETFFVLAPDEEADLLCAITEEEDEEEDSCRSARHTLANRVAYTEERLSNTLLSEIEWCNTEMMVFENSIRHLPTISYANHHSRDSPTRENNSPPREMTRKHENISHTTSRSNARPRVTCKSLFDLPDLLPSVVDQRINVDIICLESVKTVDRKHSLLCTIRVKNICFAKRVFLRCSQDGWSSYVDLPASYMYSDKNQTTDVFTVAVGIPSPAILSHVAASRGMVCRSNIDSSKNGKINAPVHTMEMAACFVPSNIPCEYWDNNAGGNYRIHWEIE